MCLCVICRSMAIVCFVSRSAQNLKKRALTLKIPKAMAESKRRRRAGTGDYCDYLHKPRGVAHRRRADPMVTLSSIFENIINDMRDMPGHDVSQCDTCPVTT